MKRQSSILVDSPRLVRIAIKGIAICENVASIRIEGFSHYWIADDARVVTDGIDDIGVDLFREKAGLSTLRTTGITRRGSRRFPFNSKG